jgi:formylmethanofuran dehydrogenase subunit B
MSTVHATEPSPEPIIETDVVCAFCGCLCDDVELHVEVGRITDARNACSLGRERFLAVHPEETNACLIDNRPASLEDGVERAAMILAAARYPVILGLDEATCEAQRSAVSLADRVGASIDSAIDTQHAAATMALQSIGEVTCTLGEIRNRADLIIIWCADPLESHPRLLDRYVLATIGTFLPGGRSDRYCVFVDIRETMSVQETADEFIAIKKDARFTALWTLRALAKGVELDPAQIETATGAPLATWQRLMDRMKAARYGVMIYSTGDEGPCGGQMVAHAAHSLARDLNAYTRFVLMPLGGSGNHAGAQNVLAWQTGYPLAVSLAEGHPRYGPGEFTANDLLSRGEADAALVVSGDPLPQLTGEARAHLSRIPRIVLGSDGSPPLTGTTVLFRTALFGIRTPGTVFRMDGVPLPLQAVLPSSLPSVEDVLRAIETRVISEASSGPEVTGDGERCR